MELHLIDTGYFYADGGAMFGAIPKTAWSKRYACNENNCCILAMRSLLIKTDDNKVILIDAGVGNKHLKELAYYQFFNLINLPDELKKYGISPEQITDIVLTHLHFDHCGWITQKSTKSNELSLSFPNAKHWISVSQWNNAHHPSLLEKESYYPEDIDLLKEKELLKLIDSDSKLSNDISLRLFNGHTPGQIVPYINTSKQTVIFAGDVIPLAASVSLGWISAYDTEPNRSYAEKVRLLEEASAKDQTILFCHDAYTQAATVKKINDFYKVDHKVTL